MWYLVWALAALLICCLAILAGLWYEIAGEEPADPMRE